MNEQAAPQHARSTAPRIAVSPSEAARLAGIGRTKLYSALSTGALRSLKIGKRRLIRIDALKDWLVAAETATKEDGDHG